MADTIVNTSPSQDSGAGWAVAVIILLAVVVGGFIWYRHQGAAAPAQPGGANINVTIPTGGGNAGGGAGNTTQ